MKRFLLPFFFLLPLTALAGDDEVVLTVNVGNIPQAEGNLLIGLFDSETTFAKQPLPQSPRIPLTNTGSFTARIKGVKRGTYAIVVIHDVNGNGQLDKNFFGMPKEPLAFSRNPRIPMGLPAFHSCSFVVDKEDLVFDIPLKLE